ncbi:MAG: toxin-antitoxin system toxin subunit [Ignavibacteriae bacterium]|nr:MAG: toxin-antitoxin system toxin subunit [Ignavibacteriota bacterium]
MLTQEEILDFLKKNNETLKEKFSVVRIGLVGSYAIGKQSESSDIDFLVEFKEPSFDDLAGLYIFLEDNFDKKIDIIRMRKYLKKNFLQRLEKTVIYG